jgi:hypothetical protein
MGAAFSIIGYAHMTFATNTHVSKVEQNLKEKDLALEKTITTMDSRIYEIWKVVVK